MNKMIERDGFKLSYCIEGSGIPTIVIGSAIYYPKTFSKELRNHLQMIFMDHRGFGTATKPFNHAAFELDILIDDIEALRQKLGIEKIVLIGHSGHAFMAVKYAKKYPSHVSHIILVATSPIGNTMISADQYFEEFASRERKALYQKSMGSLSSDIELNPDKRFIAYSLRSAPRIWYNHQYDATHLWENVSVVPEMFDYVWGDVFKNIDITEDLEDIYQPILTILGRHDYWNPPYLWNDLTAKFKNLTVSILEKSGHTPQLEEPALFDKTLLQWLNQTHS